VNKIFVCLIILFLLHLFAPMSIAKGIAHGGTLDLCDSYSDPVGVEPITDLMPPQWRKYRDWSIVKGVNKFFDGFRVIPIIGEPVKKLWENIYDNHIRPPADRQEWEKRHGKEHPFAP
jgi:hypothetical protein